MDRGLRVVRWSGARRSSVVAGGTSERAEHVGDGCELGAGRGKAGDDEANVNEGTCAKMGLGAKCRPADDSTLSLLWLCPSGSGKSLLSMYGRPVGDRVLWA